MFRAFLLVLTLFAALEVRAESDASTSEAEVHSPSVNPLTVNLFTGLNFSNLATTREVKEFGTRLTPTLGIGMDLPLGPMFAIEPQLVYLKGGTSISTGVSNVYSTFSFDYLHLPLLAKLKFGSESFRFSIFLGPSFALLVNNELYAQETRTGEEFRMALNRTNSLDIQAHAGLGLEINLASNVAFLLSARYMHGFIGVVDTTRADNMYNRGVLVTTGVAVSL